MLTVLGSRAGLLGALVVPWGRPGQGENSLHEGCNNGRQVKAATLVNVPTLIIDAENEELMDRTQQGQAAYEQIARKGNVPTRYEVIKGISHYDVYRNSFDVASDLAVDWFNQYLKGDN